VIRGTIPRIRRRDAVVRCASDGEVHGFDFFHVRTGCDPGKAADQGAQTDRPGSVGTARRQNLTGPLLSGSGRTGSIRPTKTTVTSMGP